jgi:CubicO group peptidase (beta-lactamase class C family)
MSTSPLAPSTMIVDNSSLQPPVFDDAGRRDRLLAQMPATDQLFGDLVQEAHIPGAVYGVILDGELVHTCCVGLRDVSAQASVTPQTVFRIASMSKSFVALAVIKLRDEGALRLDDAVERYAPEVAGWRLPTSDAPPITLRHLLTMTAGLPEDNPWGDRQMALDDAAFSALLANGVTFANVPGMVYEYSNLAYMLLGRVVSNLSGIPMAEYVTQQILQPLGMSATVWEPAHVPSENWAHGYRRQDGAWLEEEVLSHGGDVAAFAGLCTSVPDLARYVACFLSSWPPRNEPERPPLRRSSLREMQQIGRSAGVQRIPASAGAPEHALAIGYGYGLFIADDGQQCRVSHSGGLPGYGSNMLWQPSHGLGVVALGNLTYAPMGQIAAKLRDRLIDAAHLPARSVPPAPALIAARAQVNRLLDRWDDELADRLFADNFFLDESRSRWLADLEKLVARHGALAEDGALQVENALRGRWKLRGERGWCWLWISLTPTVPPLVQALEIDSVLPPTPLLQRAVESLGALLATPTRRGVDLLFIRSSDRAEMLRRIRLANLQYGVCRIGEQLTGDGETQASFRLFSAQAELTITAQFDPKTGKMTTVDIQPKT